MSITIGVDPGVAGAIALLDSYGEIVAIHDIPITEVKVGKKTARRVSPQLLAGLFADEILDAAGELDEDTYGAVVIENVASSPQMGVASAFNFGRSKGVLEGFFASQHLRIVYATPSTWKRQMGLGADKEQCRLRALERWPSRAQLFARKKDDGRAEAALIALWHVEGRNGHG